MANKISFYPLAFYLRNTKKENRICNKCGKAIHGRGCTMVVSIAKGKYLCTTCWDAKVKDNG